MSRPRRSFRKACKVEAVQLLTEGGQSVAQVARDLGIRDTMFALWKQELVRNPETAFPGQGHGTPEEEKLRRLRRENEWLRMERAILKKAGNSLLEGFSMRYAFIWKHREAFPVTLLCRVSEVGTSGFYASLQPIRSRANRR